MHLRAGVVERRNAQECVVLGLPVVSLLDLAAVDKAAVLQDDRLGEARRAGREVDRSVVVLRHLQGGRSRRAVGDEGAVRLRERRAVLADVEPRPDLRDAVDDLLDASGELGAEHQRARVRKLEAVLYLVRRVAEVERHGHAARLQDAEVDRQPLEAVHEEDGDLVAALVSAREEEVREPVGLLVEVAPSHVGAVRPVRGGLNKLRLPPGLVPSVVRRVDLHKGDVARPLGRVALQYLGDVVEFVFHGHLSLAFSLAFSLSAFAFSLAFSLSSGTFSFSSWLESSLGHVLMKS